MSTTEAQEHSGQPRDDEAGGELIRLEELGKQYPDGTVAVEGLSMSIPRGDTVVLVGPSGCGKTTTLKMINRIIEPTSGRIFFQGEDVTQADPDDLRRHMGYVIQQTGLFPHMTIFDNVATVPRLLKWDEDRVRERANELIELVGLDPSEYADRFPKELSGGQQQRVGVARALGGDPPVMLMDEPFGATDPITRVRLQDEFLDLQRRVQKTTVFVTHDIDEAIKMGTRIAILRQKSQIAQYETPENILSAPADDFVADFIGGGKSLKRLNLARVRDAELTDWPTASVDDDRSTLLDRLRDSGHDTVLLLDDRNRPQRWVRRRELEGGGGSLQDVGVPAEALVQPDTTLAGALNEMLESRFGAAAVVDSDGAYEAAVDMPSLVRAIGQMQEAAEQSSVPDDGRGGGPTRESSS